MAIIAGYGATISVGTGIVSVSVFYDNIDGRPTRIDTVNTTGRGYRVRLATLDGSREAVATIQSGSRTINIVGALANALDLRRYGDDAGELPLPNPKPCEVELSI